MRQFLSVTLIMMVVMAGSVERAFAVSRFVISAVDVTSDSNQDTIRLSLNAPFSQIPILDYETGLARITLPDTSFDSKLSRITVNDRFIQSITLAAEVDNTILEVQFADLGFHPVGLVSYRNASGAFHIIIQRKQGSPPEEEESLIASEISSAEIGRDDSPELMNYLTDKNYTRKYITAIAALAFILLLIYILSWLFKKFFTTRFRMDNGKYNIRVASSYHISPKQKVLIVEVNEMAFALGVTSNQVSLISRVSKESFAESMRQLNLPQKQAVDFVEIRNQYLASKQKKVAPSDVEAPVGQSFASELIARVKKLKPLD